MGSLALEGGNRRQALPRIKARFLIDGLEAYSHASRFRVSQLLFFL